MIGLTEYFQIVVSFRVPPTKGVFKGVSHGGARECLAIDRINAKRFVHKSTRLGNIFGRSSPIEPSPALKIEVHRVGLWRLLRASRLGGDQRRIKLARQTTDDLVLHLEEVG